MLILTYVGPADDYGTLNAVDVGDDMPPSHHFFLRLGAQEYIDSENEKIWFTKILLTMCSILN